MGRGLPRTWQLELGQLGWLPLDRKSLGTTRSASHHRPSQYNQSLLPPMQIMVEAATPKRVGESGVSGRPPSLHQGAIAADAASSGSASRQDLSFPQRHRLKCLNRPSRNLGQQPACQKMDKHVWGSICREQERATEQESAIRMQKRAVQMG